MKNWDELKIEKFKYITVVYIQQLESIKLMVQEHYDTPEYDDTLFLINTLGSNIPLLNKDDFKQHRKIYYNFEHSNDLNPEEKFYVQDLFKDFGVTEVWTMEPNCETFDTDLGVKYKPVRYTSYIKKIDYHSEPKFDLGFAGIVGSYDIAPRRNKFFNDYLKNTKYNFSIKILNGHPISEMQDEFANCRFILDSHRNYMHNMQNQVRIFEHICLGHTVLSEKSDYNIFPGLIYEWENIDELNDLINTIKPEDFSEKYKEMTYTDEAYENYCSKLINGNYYKKTFEYFLSRDINKSDLINKLIDNFDYKTYLEIGVDKGECLYNIKPTGGCWKVGVDPNPESKATCHLTSDEFFNILEHDGFNEIKHDFNFDIILIDGLHLWEQCYKDINNALNHLSPNGIIICHDMNPLEEMYQSRINNIGYWNGDVWKAFVKVRTERSDIFSCMIEDFDCGLGVITWGTQEPIKLDKPFEELLYKDFVENKAYLMNTTTLDKFIEHNKL